MSRRCGQIGALLAVVAIAGCGDGPATVRAAARVVPSTVAAPIPARAVVLPQGCSARADACVSEGHRLAWLQQDGRVTFGPVPVGLGSATQPTPRGAFRVAWKDEEHTSSTYGTDMPYSVFFAAGGIAFHQGPLDEPSHGCVHLPPRAAGAFFAALEPGDRIEVF